MSVAEDSYELPNDSEALKKLVIAKEDEIEQWKKAHAKEAKAYRALQEKYEILRHAYFGRKSEQWSTDDHLQSSLFDEAESIADGDYEKSKTDTITYTVTKKRRGKRQVIPESIPRKEVVLDLPEEEKVCACGSSLQCIGKEQSEKLDIIPAQIRAIRFVRLKYACPCCEGSGDEEHPAVRIAPLKEQLLPKSIATAGLVSHIAVSKYCDAIPLHRQEKMFKRIGVDISRGSMARWIIKIGSRLSPLLTLMDKKIREGPLLQMDETPVQVHNEPKRDNSGLSYMWVVLGGPPDTPFVRYMYYPTRSGTVALSYLAGYKGYLQTDGYSAYNRVGEQDGIVHVGCLAHARRKFHEATKVSGGSPAAQEFLTLIRNIYCVEKELRAKDLDEADFVKERKEQVNPLMDKLTRHLEKKAQQVAPSTALGKAIAYTREVLPRIQRYVDCVYLTPDNNAAERAIRPFVLGRKNWLFSDTPSGAHASAAFYSLIESAKSASLEPYWYIRYVLEKLVQIEKTNNWEELLPQNLTSQQIHMLTP